jgi:uncharacterized damage-inducible protein DinB
MSMVEHYRRLFRYNEWANREVLASLQKGGTARSIELFAHIISAERVWLERIRKQAQPFPVWPGFDSEKCEVEAAESARLWREKLAQISEKDLAEPVSYTNTVGERYTSRMEDILMHVITHSTYHRGQIATDTRAGGQVPAYTDFIHAIRQGFVE